MNAQLEERNITIIDGIAYDSETGEAIHNQFAIDSDERADWYLEKLLNAEADLAREEIKLKALTESQGARVKDAQRRVDGLRRRFDGELAEYAKTKLDGKSKTVKFPFGSVSFRTVKGGLRVNDNAEAIGWAEERGFRHAVKVTETFQISMLNEFERKQAINDAGTYGVFEAAFEIKPDTESVTVKTGVGS